MDCRFIQVIPGTFPISLRLTSGFVAPLFTTAVGSAIAAQLSDGELESLVTRVNQRIGTRGDRVDLKHVIQTSRDIRRRGYALYYDSLFPDTGAIGVPFPTVAKSIPMAIGVGGLRHRIRRNAGAIYRAIQSSMENRRNP